MLKKLWWLLLLGILLASVAITNVSKSNAATTWQNGTPAMFHHQKYVWLSNYRKSTAAKYVGGTYERDLTYLDAHHGINITPFYYDHTYKNVMVGADDSAFANRNPHYRTIGSQTYQLTAGALSKNTLHKELYSKTQSYGNTYRIQVLSKTRVSIATYQHFNGTGKLSKAVIFDRYPKSGLKKLMKVKYLSPDIFK